MDRFCDTLGGDGLPTDTTALDRTVDWARLPYFLAVARSGSLRAAAETLGGTHATVDRNLRALETAYGVRLFDRTKTGLHMTPAGEALLPLAEEAEESVIAARRRLQGLDREASGLVRVSIPTPFASSIFPEILAQFERQHPDIELNIAVTNRFEDLTRAETDVSIRIAHQVDDDVVGRKVLQYASGIYASQDYIDRAFATAGAKGEGLQWIGWGDSAGLPDWVRSSPFPKARIRYTLRSPALIANMVEAGMGMSYLPCWATHSLDGLVMVPGTEPYLDRSLWILLHSDLRRTTRVRLFVDFVAAELKSRRAIFTGPMA